MVTPPSGCSFGNRPYMQNKLNSDKKFGVSVKTPPSYKICFMQSCAGTTWTRNIPLQGICLELAEV
jgi:hypothetical protein